MSDGIWILAPKTFTKRTAVTNIVGPTDSGRTSLALSSAGPIALIHTSEKYKGVIEPFARQKEIKLVDIPLPFRRSSMGDLDKKVSNIEALQEACKPLVDKFYEAFFDAYKWAKTVIIDTDDQLYVVFQMAAYGTSTPASSKGALNWAEMNAEWLSLLSHARRQMGCNTVFISGASNEWKLRKNPSTGKESRQKTDKLIRDGHDYVPKKCDVCIRCEQVVKDGGAHFTATVTKGWMSSAEVNGFSLSGKASTLPMFMSRVVPGSKLEEWQ